MSAIKELLVYFKMPCLKVLQVIVTAFCIIICIYELIIIAMKLKRESFEAISEIQYDELLAPSITLCPGNLCTENYVCFFIMYSVCILE